MGLDLNIEPNQVQNPKHVAVIMDGNGRWAKQRGLERFEGHAKGVDSLREMIAASLEFGIEYLTVYAFSKENWSRPSDEVACIMDLFCSVIAMEVDSLNERGVRVIFLAEEKELSEDVLKTIDRCTESTKNNTKMTLVIALNYSSRSEITNAVKKISQKVQKGELSIDDISEKLIGDHLLTKGIPDPDLVIRTSGEVRISNFLLWQVSYSEFVFCDKYWPDFTRSDFADSLNIFLKRKRRFGNIE